MKEFADNLCRAEHWTDWCSNGLTATQRVHFPSTSHRKGEGAERMEREWERGRKGERGRGGGGGGRGGKGKGEWRGGREREKIVARWQANRQIIDFKI